MAVEQAIKYDSSKCTACKGCQVACKQWNQLPSPLVADEYEFTKSFQSPLDNGPNNWLVINFTEVNKDVGIDWNFMRNACFHCNEAACLEACPVGAISRNDNGAVVINQDKCIGCRYCVASCPFGIPRWNEASNTTFKCRQCDDRVAFDRRPACVSTCPTGALEFGDRADMVAAAKERVAELKAAGYKDAEMYGENELGGLHTIVVAQRGLEAHGLKRDPKIGVTEFWQVLKPLGALGIGATIAGLGFSFFMGRNYSRGEYTYDEATDTVNVKEVEK